MAQSIATSEQNSSPAAVVVSAIGTSMSRAAHWLRSAFANVRARLDTRIVTEVDIEKVVADLDVEERGRTDGVANRPPPSEESVAGMQREIIAHFRFLQRRSRRKAAASMEKLLESGNAIDISQAISAIREIPARCEADIERVTAKIQAELDRSIRSRGQHRETRSAEYAAIDNATAARKSALTYALAAILLIFGSATLVSSLAQGSVALPETWATGLLAFSVLLPFVMTREILQIADPDQRWQRIMATLGIGVSIVFIGVLAALAAVYVSAFGSGASPNLWDVLNVLAASTQRPDIAAAGWFGTTTVGVAGLLAVALARRSVDWRAHRRTTGPLQPDSAPGSLQSFVIKLQRQSMRLIDQAESRIDALDGRVRKQVRQYCRNIEERRSMPGDLSNYDNVLEEACNIVLDRYRAANRDARSLDDPPSFNTHAQISQDDSDCSAALEVAASLRDRLAKTMEDLDRETMKARQRLRDLNHQVLSTTSESGVTTAAG